LSLDRARVIFGCGNVGGMGSSPAHRDKGDDAERAFALLDHARRLGLARFDTANTYGGGASETILGAWLARQGRAYRSGVEVATKVGNPYGCAEGDTPLSGRQVAYHVDESLRRLGVERIDLYYLHEFDHVTPLEETLEALEAALSAGKIAAFGVSNAALVDLTAVLALTSAASRRAFTTVQNQFNLLETGDLEAVIPLCQAEGIDYVAFSPLAGGFLTGKYQRGAVPGPDSRAGAAPGMFSRYLTDETFDRIDALRATAEANGWTLAETALRGALGTPGLSAVIIAPRSAEQFAAYGLEASRV
jgi:aryl-alcohol dehydrogenase-like predicted oxidoreductase